MRRGRRMRVPALTAYLHHVLAGSGEAGGSIEFAAFDAADDAPLWEARAELAARQSDAALAGRCRERAAALRFLP